MIVASKAAHSFLIAWALALLSSATAGGTASDPNMTSEEFFATMAAQADTPDISYDLIKRRLLEGRYDDARAVLDRRDTTGEYVFSGYRFALLRARCARAVFLFGPHRIRPEGQSDAERGVLLRQVALQTTIAYEEAFRSAPSDFERACVYARWHELHTRSNFEADSLLLRSGNPLEHLDRPVDETLSKQAARLRAVASKALDSVDLNSSNLTIDRQAFLDVLISEYEKLGRMGVPAAVFDEILEDVPQFLQEAIDSFVLVQPEKFRVTIQYYLWYALTGPRPDRIDNEFIDRQIRTVDQYLRYALTSAGSGYEEAVSQRFLGQVAIERNNRFILHFKEPLWPQEWSEQRPGSTAKNIQQAIIDRINSEVSQFGQGPIQHLLSRFLTQEQLRKELDEQIARSVRSLAGSAIFELTRYQNLLRHQHPPGARFTGGGGTGHRTSGIEVWRSDKSEPTPPYPWKKNLTRLDSAVASTRKIAQRMLTAVASTDTATLDALSLDSKGFSREDLHRLIQTLSDHRVEIEPERARDTNDIVVVQPYTWTALRVASETDEALALVFCRKEGGYWLAWAGLTEGISVQPLAILLEQLKPELESRPINEQRDIAPPAAIASLDDVRDINTVDPIEAGHAWRVRLAFGEYAPLPSAQALYCQAEWIDPNRPAKAVPFGRFAGKHVGPVLWTLAADGFREGPLGFNSQAAPRMTLRGDGCLYAAILPPSSTSQVYVQVYSAFDSRELARRRIEPTAAVPWGHFMAHKSGELYGVATTFEAACPALPAFKPLPSSTPETITLSLEGDVFAIKSGSRILPARGTRLLARWWVNDKPVPPQPAANPSPILYPDARHVGTLFRVPATLPIANLKAQRGDKVGLQIMLAPDRVDCSTAYGASGQNVVCLDTENIPTIPIVSKRINFKVTAAMLAQRNTAAPTTTQVAQLSNAIGARDARKVRRLAVACPRLVYDGIPTPSVVSATASQGGVQLGGASASPSGNLQQTALEQLCHIRPQPKKRGWARQLFWWMDDDNAIDERFWKETAEVATVLIDYGADVNAGSQANRPPLWMLLTEGLVFAHRQKDAPPVALVETFLRRGADPNAADRTHTLLWDVTKGLYSYQSPRMPEVIECLVDNGVDVLATVEPFQQESVFDQAGSLQPDLATPILRAGRQRIAALEPAATLGVAEILADLRNADQEALLVLQDDLPCFEGTNWARMTRSLHESLGVGLDGIGPIAKTALTGRWAQAILPTGRQGDQAYLHVVLMRYPGGAYHAIRAFLTDTQKPTYTNSIEGSTRRISAAIEYALGHIDAGRASGQQSSSISGGLEALVVTNERGRLAVQTIQPSGWRSYYAELTPGAVLLWEDVWELSLRSRVVWETAPRQIVMKNGALTIRNGVKTLTFEVSGDQVRLQEPDGDRFGSEFRVDTETLDVQSDRQTP